MHAQPDALLCHVRTRIAAMSWKKPVPALLAALTGGAISWLWFIGGGAAPATASPAAAVGVVVTVIVLAAIGFGLEASGRGLLLTDPAVGVRLMSGWLVFLIGAGALCVAACIFVAIAFEPVGATIAEKKFGTAMVTAIAAFVSGVLLKGLDDVDGNYLAPRARKAFESAFKGMFDKGSDEQLAVFANEWNTHSGWGWTARAARARRVKEKLSRR